MTRAIENPKSTEQRAAFDPNCVSAVNGSVWGIGIVLTEARLGLEMGMMMML
jgi:hypothetical protein